MNNDVLVWIAWSFIFSFAFLTWIITFKNNHYKRGYRDGYHRGKVVASERYID